MARQARPLRQPPRRRASSTRPRASSSSWSRSGSGSGSGSGSRRRAPGWSSAPASTTAQMVSALGINIQLTFAIAFFVGSALAGLGGVFGGSFASLAPGVDANWLLNSLVVVIIGGMGSLGGAAVGALAPRPDDELRGHVPAVRLHVLLDHLHLRAPRDRPRGPSARALRDGRREADDAYRARRRAWRSRRRALAPLYSATYFVTPPLTQTLCLGIAAASLIFLSAYGGMVSLAQVAIYGIAGFAFGNLVTNGNRRGSTSAGIPGSGLARDRDRDGRRARLRGAREPELRHLLPHDHARLLGHR